MRTRILSAAAAGALLAMVGAGCASSGKPALDDGKPGSPSRDVADGSPTPRSGLEPAPASTGETAEAPGKAAGKKDDGRKPYRIGDFLVYPLQWRNAEETAFRLYVLLYPKYGPYLQVVPDPNTNSLLIYLPPENLRPTGGPDA